MEYITGKISLSIIFRLHWANYVKWYTGNIREMVYENVNKILKCRTPLLGFHMYKCIRCGRVRLMPHSCKSRFCNSCGKIMTDKWTDETIPLQQIKFDSS